MSGTNVPPLLTVFANGTGVVLDAQLNTFVQSGIVVANLRNFVGLTGMVCYLTGTTTSGDGGAGNFYWNSSSTATDDGQNFIAPTGILTGRWIRISGGSSEATSVVNIAALRALASPPSVSVIVEGYYSAGDFGGGVFNYVSSDTTSADNGGTIIVDAGNHRWYRATDGKAFSAAWFGCYGNASTNDATALGKAATAAIAAGVAVVIAGTVGSVLSIAANTTLAAQLDFTAGGQLAPTTGTTITINGKIVAPPTQQLFANAVASEGTIVINQSAATELSVKWWGALGNASNNDAPAIQAAINCAIAGNVLCVHIPTGNYMCNAGITYATNSLRVYSDTVGTLIQTTTLNVTLWYVNGNYNTIENLQFSCNTLQTSVACCVQFYDCVESRIIDCNIFGGYYGLAFTNGGADNIAVRCKVTQATGAANVFVQDSNAYFYRLKADQNWPYARPTNAQLVGAWTASTAYTLGQVVSSQGFYLQCIVAGTSGLTQPTILRYGNNIVDGLIGAVTWQMACATTQCAMQVDTGSIQVFAINSDFTGAYVRGIYLTDTGGTGSTGPQLTIIEASDFDSQLQSGIEGIAGAGLLVHNCTFGPLVETGSTGIYLHSSWVSDAEITANLIQGVGTGVFLAAGQNTNISNNDLVNCSSAGAYVSAGVQYFTINGNNAGKSTTWGANAYGITVQTGSSDYYVITGNNTGGATSGGVTDGGSGSHKVVANNL